MGPQSYYTTYLPSSLRLTLYNLHHACICIAIESLYDVFVNIRDDEAEHAETMLLMQRDVAVTSRGKL